MAATLFSGRTTGRDHRIRSCIGAARAYTSAVHSFRLWAHGKGPCLGKPVLSGQKRNHLERYVETQPIRPATPNYSPEPSALFRPLQPLNRQSRPVAAAATKPPSARPVHQGEITGSESLFIDGKIEGSINLPGNRVTVGRNGQVASTITAREIVILGKVRGNVTASDRVDIRAEGALTGDVTAARISIEDAPSSRAASTSRRPMPSRQPQGRRNRPNRSTIAASQASSTHAPLLTQGCVCLCASVFCRPVPAPSGWYRLRKLEKWSGNGMGIGHVD